MMTTWTLQKGIPLVVVSQEGHSLRLRQEPFLSWIFEEDPGWRALQERWLLFFCCCSLPHLSLLVTALAFFRLLWQLWVAISLYRNQSLN